MVVAAYVTARKMWLASDGELSMIDLLNQAFEFIDYQPEKLSAK
jgi:hypothetical protein